MDGTQKIEGARAFSKGVARHLCPYASGSIGFEDWMDGWAQQKASDERSEQAHAMQTQFARVG